MLLFGNNKDAIDLIYLSVAAIARCPLLNTVERFMKHSNSHIYTNCNE